MTESDNTVSNPEAKIPAAVGERLQIAHRLDDRPRTLREWGRAIGDIVSREDIDVGLGALCLTDQSPHRARFDGTTQHFACVQDAFIVPYVVDDVGTVEITTESPVSGERIEVTVADGGIEADPPGAVTSVGVAADVAEQPVNAESPEIAYEKICPYGHAFLNREEYEEWAATVDEATMVTPLGDTFQLAQAIADATQ